MSVDIYPYLLHLTFTITLFHCFQGDRGFPGQDGIPGRPGTPGRKGEPGISVKGEPGEPGWTGEDATVP